MPSAPLTTTLISVPFLTAGIDGCTALFSDVDITAIDEVIMLAFTGPEILVGIANVAVLVTSPLIFVVTPRRTPVEGVAVVIGDGLGEIVGIKLETGVGEAVTSGS